MDIKQLKNYLYENQDKLQFVLEECGFKHIKKHSGSGDNYLTMANYDGNNQSAITVYLSEHLLTINYTRDICPNKSNCDVLDLICFARKQAGEETFFQTLKWVAETSGIGYYTNLKSDIPESIKIIKRLKEMLSKVGESEEEDVPIEPKDEKILSYYLPYANKMFEEDGIPCGVQREFEIGFDLQTNRITIPCRDEIGSFVGVKGRYAEREVPENELKYYYIETFSKGKILYGYYRSKDFIRDSDTVICAESEKSFLQMWSMGYNNCVATGGTKITRTQIDKLSRLGKKILFAFDKDFTEQKLQDLRNKFLGQIDFWAVIDRDNILGEKESPSDNKEKFEYLMKNNIYRIEKEGDQ